MRRALGMTQADLSRASGLSQKTISRIEAAKNANITWEVLIALAEAFGVNLNAFTEVLPPEAPTSKAS
jgi:transcriptional regulator with XRE-family HTH domain